MKLIFFCLPILFVFCGCEKSVQNIKEDLVIKAMTVGHWAITSFNHNGTNITSDFAEYLFKYYKNKTVDALKNGTVEITGNWDGNSANKTTWANFNGASYPISLINGTWNIVRNGWTFVEATQTSGNDTKTMRLDKR